MADSGLFTLFHGPIQELCLYKYMEPSAWNSLPQWRFINVRLQIQLQYMWDTAEDRLERSKHGSETIISTSRRQVIGSDRHRPTTQDLGDRECLSGSRSQRRSDDQMTLDTEDVSRKTKGLLVDLRVFCSRCQKGLFKTVVDHQVLRQCRVAAESSGRHRGFLNGISSKPTSLI